MLNELLALFFVKNKKIYIEPYLGSGIVLINVLKNNNIMGYEKFYVNDINSNIINFYIMLRDDLEKLIKEVKKLEKIYNNYDMTNKEIMYYKLRDKYNSKKTKNTSKVILFYFLMKAGFNGVYRENSKGLFNVPFGKKNIITVNCDNLREISSLIQNVEFYNMDYKLFLRMLKDKKKISDSFIYCDPPYLPEDMCVTKRIDIYTREYFDHEEFFSEIKKYNTDIMISLAHTKKSDEIYNKDNFHIVSISNIMRTINPKKVFSSEEIGYVNYEISQK